MYQKFVDRKFACNFLFSKEIEYENHKLVKSI